jgi:pimeloyl-ACP methyl ester carboxylesterase
MKMALLGQMNHPFGLPPPTPLTDDELRSIAAPTTAVIAARSAPFDPTVAARRATLIPNATVDVVEGAGHEVSWTHVERCTSHVTNATL